MKEEKIETPHQLVECLISLFPKFGDEWDDGESGGSPGEYEYHTVFFDLVPDCCSYLRSSSPQTVKKFCTLINSFVAAGGNKENAVSTALLEHASQVGIAKMLKPHLSADAKAELR